MQKTSAPVDLPKRFLMLNLIYPLDDMISSVDHHVWPGAPAPEPRTKADDNMKNLLQQLKVLVDQTKPEEKGFYISDTNAKTAAPPERTAKVIEMLRTVVEVLAKTMQGKFNAADLV